MEVVKVDDVVLEIVGAEDEIPDQLRVGRHGDGESILDGPHGSQRMDGRADTAGALAESPGVTRIPAPEDNFDAADHGAEE